MEMEPFAALTSRVVVLPARDVDTDQIIPARFLKGTSRAGIAAGLFAEWRARDPAFPLDVPAARGARILLTGENFGCGSSREHAAWALYDHGFRVVLAPRFADIFRNNALGNGLLAVELEAATLDRLAAQVASDPTAEVTVDLVAATVTLPGGATAAFTLPAFARHCLLTGRDALGHLLDQLPAITAWEAGHGPAVDTWQAVQALAAGGGR